MLWKITNCSLSNTRRFLQKNTSYNKFADLSVQSNQIKEGLHEILMHAIFKYKPCSKLLSLCKHKKHKPTPAEWGTDKGNWISLGSEPYQIVST